MWTTLGRSGRDDAEVLLRVKLDFASVMVEGFAEGAKAYWLMWGTLGGPAIGLVEMAAEVQRRYLQSLRSTLG